MSSKKVVFYNTFIQLIGKVISIVINIVIVYLLTHHFSITDYGKYSTVLSYLLFFNILADLGLSTIIVRDINDYTDDEKPTFVGNIFMIRAISLVVSLTVGIIIAELIPQYDQTIKIGIIIYSIATFFLLFSMLLFSIFQIHLKIQKSVVANNIGMIANLILVIIFIKFHLSILFILSAVCISYFLMFLVAFFESIKLQPISFRYNALMTRRILLQSLTVGGMILFSSIYFKADSLLLTLMKSYRDVSLYGVPYKILEVLIAFPQMFMAPVFALLSKIPKDQDRTKFLKVFQKSFDFLALAGLPIIPAAYFLSNKAIVVYAGKQYLISGSIFQILSIAIFLSFLGTSLIFVILLFKNQRYLLYWNILLSVLNIVLNIIFIPRYSYYAAAWITVITELFVFAGSLYFVQKSIHFLPHLKVVFRGVLATICFTLTLYFLQGINLVLQASLAAIVYGAALFLFQAITKADIVETLLQK